MPSLTTVATFRSPAEAHLARSRLLDAGISDVFVADEVFVATAGHLEQAVGGVKLQVPASEAQRATALLEQEGAAASARVATTLTADDAAERALRTAAFGMFFPPLQLLSFWFVYLALAAEGPLSPRSRRRLVYTALLDLWLFAFVGLIVVGIMAE